MILDTIMIKNYFGTAWRSLLRNKYFTLIHILGLGIGIACCIFIFFYIQFHLSYDRYHKQAKHIYRVVHDLHLEKIEHESGSSYAIYDALKSKVPGIEHAAFSMSHQDLTLNVNGNLFSSNKKAAFTSSEWFKLFNYHWLQGNATALNQPNTVALMASTAERFFGKTEAMGQTIYVDGKYPLKVIGVIDDQPTNTDLKSDLYISEASIKTVLPNIRNNYFTDWGYINTTNQLYVSINDSSNIASIESTLQQLTNRYFGEETGKLFHFKLQALKDIHFDTNFGGSVQKSLLWILGFIGLSILLIATLNYINLSLIQYAKRSAEIGTRKVLGGSSSQLFFQFITESICVVGLACLLGLALLQIVFPIANQILFINEPIAKPSLLELSGLSLVIWSVISLLSGIYPAYMTGKLAIVNALKNNFSLGSTNGRKAMVLVQNILSLCLIIATIVMVAQVRFLSSTDVGFNRESVLLVPLPKRAMEKEKALRTFLDNKLSISNYSFCFRAPAMHDSRGGTFLFDQRADYEAWATKATFADSAYISTLDIPLIAGRNIRENKTLPEYLINQKMMHMLGYKNEQQVLGKSLLGAGMHDEKPGIIVGVIANYNTKSLHDPIDPTVIGYDRELFQTVAIKINSQGLTHFIKQLEQEWPKWFPNTILNYQYLDEQIEELYIKEAIQQKLIWTAATLAIFISSLGLLGLISLSVLQRTKEIGIRKVLGASLSSILNLLSKDFIKIIFIALMVASPITWWAMSKWLEDFAYHIELQWWMFVLAGLMALVIALLTVSWQAIKAALANPVESLRNE
ncbi:FtsX-like permease family protein [Olivibacter domesticus]|uniref:FtsX-like permease family protein n=2 Tax=Olivibacter domesticus TaxID=407022 RepID=A0A1H7SHE2_OLID1|nr:FtsX-like permease family protein [Olivibacter domesticus]